MPIACACGRTIPATDVNLDRLVARCNGCDSVFDIAASLRALAAPRARPIVPLPASLRVFESPLPTRPDAPYRGGARPSPSVSIVRRWFTLQYIPLALFCVFWDGILVLMYLSLWRGPAFALLVPLFHVSAGAWLTYSTIAGFFNTTIVRLRDGVLSVRHGPVPWRGACDLVTADIVQLFCQQDAPRWNRQGSARTYAVLAVMKSGPARKLVGGLPESTQALFLEQELESRLSLSGEPVAGELRT